MQPTAIDKPSRIEVIDVLRGFTLLGIIIVHFTEQYYAGQPPEAHMNFTAKNLADQIVSGLTGIFIQGKFFMIFSFLFGLSFYLQSSKSSFSAPFLIRFSWRLTVLFFIGFIHHLHYRGDILGIYAVLGFGLLVADRLPDRTLLIVSLLLIFNVPSFMIRLYDGLFSSGVNPFLSQDQKPLELYYDTVSKGTYLQILKANFAEFRGKIDFQLSSGRAYITLGLFLLGLYAGRKKFFETWEQQIPFIKQLCKRCFWMIGGSILFGVAIFGGTYLAGIKLNEVMNWAFGGLIYDSFNTCLATLYVMGILLLFRKEGWHRRLMKLYPAGRMGLTTYLCQTLAGFLIFFAPGLGLLGMIGATVSLVIGLVVFGIQMAFSQWWLSKFHYGPVEWLWRTLTFFKWQPFVKISNSRA